MFQFSVCPLYRLYCAVGHGAYNYNIVRDPTLSILYCSYLCTSTIEVKNSVLEV